MAMDDARPGAFEWDVGSAIGTTFSIVFGNFISFIGLALLIGVPSLLMTLAGTNEFLPLVVDLVLGQVVTITLIYGTVQSLRGNKVGITEALSQGLGRLPAALGVALLSGLGIVIGLFLLVIPGLYLATLWAVAVPVVVIERAGVGGSFSRSSELTDGRRWRVFGALLVMGIITVVTTSIVNAATGGASGEGQTPVVVLQWAVAAITQAFMSTLSGVLYTFLRRDKEGADIESIAAVFD
jgi:hypothetical protein